MSGICAVRGWFRKYCCPVFVIEDTDLARVCRRTIARRANHFGFRRSLSQVLDRKYSYFHATQISARSFAIPTHSEGRWPSSQTLGRVAVDAAALRAIEIAGRISVSDRSAQDERRCCVRQNRVVLAPVAGVQAGGGFSSPTGRVQNL